jgi:hypothetical protein
MFMVLLSEFLGREKDIKHMNNSRICRLMSLVFVLLCGLQAANGQKLKTEEIIAKHLEAMGGAETLKSVTTRIFGGTVISTFKTPALARFGGRAVLASDGRKNLMAMVFDQTNYPQEKIGFDGSDVSASYIRPGIRSDLSEFLLAHRAIIKQGVWGGALSQAWPLLNAIEYKVKVESAGTKKIDDRMVHQLKFYPIGTDLRVTMFFDAETFHHVRTEYNRSIEGQMGRTPETSASTGETRYKLVEDFSDFRKEGGLTLPHAYKIYFETAGRSGSYKAEWDITLSEFQFNQRIDPTVFDVDDKKNKSN